MMRRLLTVAIVVAALASCTTFSGGTVESRGFFSKWFLPCDTSVLVVGMSEQKVRALERFPDAINSIHDQNGAFVQWVYRSQGIYLYFQNGRLVSWSS